MKKLFYSLTYKIKILRKFADNYIKLIYEKSKLGKLRDLIFDEDYKKLINSTNTSLIDIQRFLKEEKKKNKKNFLQSLIVLANDQYKFIKSKKNIVGKAACIPISSVNYWVLKNGLPRSVYWCTDNYDQNCQFLRNCFKEKIKVNTISNYCPTRPWNFDPIMKSSMLDEYYAQLDSFGKFGHGEGLDFGYLLQFVRELIDLGGDYIEIGCFNGSSGCFMLNYLNQYVKKNKLNYEPKFFFFDVFDGFNYTEALESGDVKWVGTHKTHGIDTVRNRLKERYTNIEVIKRNICEPNPLRECSAISFANIDVDIYEATLSSLEAIDKKLLPNGIIVVEDSGHIPCISGALAAVEEFDESTRGNYTKIHLGSAQTIFIKRSKIEI